MEIVLCPCCGENQIEHNDYACWFRFNSETQKFEPTPELEDWFYPELDSMGEFEEGEI